MLQSQIKKRDLWWNASDREGAKKQGSNKRGDIWKLRRKFQKGGGGGGRGSKRIKVLEIRLKFPPGSLYSMVQLTLAPCVSSAVKGDVLGGRSGSMMLMI